MCTFRTLRADEIDVRAQQVSEYGGKVSVTLLLYKDARVDMALLDEHFGIFGWQREHSFKDGRNYCRVSVRNPDTGEWIAKEDVGTESNTEAEKGQASDAFKRACVNLGIGRELYTSPIVKVHLNDKEFYKSGTSTRMSAWMSFSVKDIEYDGRRCISRLSIVDQNGNIRYEMGKKADAPKETPKEQPKEEGKDVRAVTMAHVGNKEHCLSLTKWFYSNGYVLCEKKEEYDVIAHMRLYYTISDEVAEAFVKKFNEFIDSIEDGRD